ncbi:cell division protein FtsB [Microbacterium resistens]|uniref:Cell division protein FtsB n=1 Tax=Microbacterium resistens TaxID=156977 RepID=A0ABU1S7X9_9MICO|nr:septum formation initiator family protein [Microbacterium resistens]MDR6865635.1 cell division protein FtsB [Microbacterium resistens]
MARRPTPPSSSSGPSSSGTGRTDPAPPSRPSRRGGARTVDVRGWVGGIRLSGFMVIMLSLVVLGAWVLVPTLGTYLDQRQKIAALEQSAHVSTEKIAELKLERERWKDPAYITTQARERLFYYKPGEVIYLVDDDLDPALVPREQDPVSDTIEERPSDWMPQILRSLTSAGLTQGVTDVPAN